MVAKPPGGRPGISPTPPVGTPAFLTLPAALPALSWLSTAALVAAPPRSLRPTEPGLSFITSPGRGAPVPGRTAAPACLATAPCRDAAPPAHARSVCFVYCMVSLLFCSLLAICSGRARYQLFHTSTVSCPYPIHSTNTYSMQGLRIHYYQATRHALLLSRFCGVTPGNKMDTRTT